MKDDYIKGIYRSYILRISHNQKEVIDLKIVWISSSLKRRIAINQRLTKMIRIQILLKIHLVISSWLSFESFHEGCLLPHKLLSQLIIYLFRIFHSQKLLKCWSWLYENVLARWVARHGAWYFTYLHSKILLKNRD